MRKRALSIIAVAALTCFALSGCDDTPPTINGLDGENVEIKCGTDFNLNDYITENVSISDETDDGLKDYSLNDLEHTIVCDSLVYDSETGAIDTGEIGDYPVSLSVKDEAGNESSTSFTLTLDPLEIEKGYYVYKDYSDSFSVMGYCSFENKSRVPLDIDEVEFQYIDGDGVTITGTDMVEFAPGHLDGAKTGYAMDTYASVQATIETEDEVQAIDVSIAYTRGSSVDETTLEVSEITRLDDYAYDTTHFGAEGILTNPHDRNVEYYEFIIGMYDAQDNLIGAMYSYDTTPINANSKAKVQTGWLPDSRVKPDATTRMQGAAYVQKFAD